MITGLKIRFQQWSGEKNQFGMPTTLDAFCGLLEIRNKFEQP